MALSGRLGAGGCADLMSALWHQGRQGILEVQAGGVDRKLVLREGEIVQLASSEAAEKLPVRIVAAGAVGRAEMVEAARGGQDLRAILEERGLLSAADHDRHLRGLVVEVVGRLFGLTDGTWVFVDKAELPLPGLQAADATAGALWQAARACTEDFARGFLGTLSQRVTRDPGADSVLAAIPALSPQEGYLLSRIDGYCSAADVLATSPLAVTDSLRLLVGFTCLGLVDVVGRPGVKLPRAGKGGSRVARAPAARPAAPVAAAPVVVAGAIPVAAAPSAAAVEPAASGPAAPSEAGSIEAARAMHARIRDLDHYQVLDVTAAAAGPDVRKAYYRLARLYHPDSFGQDLGAADREVVEELFARIGDAFSVLSDDELRKEYDERLKSGQVEAEKEDKPADPKTIARESFEKGRALAAAGDRAQGMRFLEHAVGTDPGNPEYRLALARFLMADSRTRRRAETHLVEALKIEPSRVEAHYLLGVLYKSGNLRTRALEQFRKGLEWDPAHAGILKEMEGLEDDPRSGGLFGRKR